MYADTITALLETFGSDLTLTRQAGDTYDPATGVYSGGASTAYTIRGVMIAYRDDMIDGSVIRVGDRRLLVDAQESETTPAIGDTVGGLSVVHVRAYAPNGTAVAWACQMRK